jgi:hypothetical protein
MATWRRSVADGCSASGESALSAIQAARGRPVPDTEEQAGWIRAYPAA